MPNVSIGKNTQIERCIIGENASVGANCRIGVSSPDALPLYDDLCTNDITVVAPKVSICSGTIIGQNCLVENDISSYVVDISYQKEESFAEVAE